jgi:hypothetical protein
MKKLMVLLFAALCVVTPALAGSSIYQTPPERVIIEGDKLVLGEESFTLHSNETLRGDFTVIGGNATLEEGSRVEGDVNVLGGIVEVGGSVGKDINVIGGSAKLLASARVDGTQNKLGGSIAVAPGAVINQRSTPSAPVAPRKRTLGDILPNLPPPFRNWEANINTEPFRGFSNTWSLLVNVLISTLLAIFAVSLFPQRYQNMVAVASTNWQKSELTGGVAWFAGVVLCIALAITLCFIPLSIMLGLILGIALLIGAPVFAIMTGVFLQKGFGRLNWTLVQQTVVGTITMTVLSNLPYVGWIISFLALNIGLGALILSRAGQYAAPQPIQAIIPTSK